MNRILCVLALFGGLACATIARADITSLTYTNDNDGAINCVVTSLTGLNTGSVDVRAEGYQFSAPGHMLGYFETSSAEDPSITFRSTVENDTGFDWWRYEVGVFLTRPFTITTATVYTPNYWSVSFTPSSTWNGFQYEGSVVLTAGLPVSGDPMNPGTLDFSYRVNFSGATSYGFAQQMAPVPEPGTVGLLLMGGLLCVSTARRMRR
jgi:hypothetical protein